MTTSLPYYEEILYPLQNEVLRILKNCDLPFYLTGGTAVSRGYFNHRYSDDLDLFVNRDEQFAKYVDRALNAFEKANLSVFTSEVSSEDYSRIHLNQNKGGLGPQGLKIDFINDVYAHFGGFQETDVYYRTDSIRNILSNKYTTLYRVSAKDVADIWEICHHVHFNWKDIIEEAEQKEIGADAKELVQVFKRITDEDFLNIKWKRDFNLQTFRNDLIIISTDIVNHKENSLF